MLKSFLLVSIRYMTKNYLFTAINVFGLATGLAACFLISEFVVFEKSYDQFHSAADRIYRVTLNSSKDGMCAANHPAVGPVLQAALPEVEEYARMIHQSVILGSYSTWTYNDSSGSMVSINESNVYDVDPSFLSIFSFSFIEGNRLTALSDTKSIVISQKVAKHLFGSDTAIGKVLVLNGFQNFIVTGVFADLPDNSHMKFDMLIAYYMQSNWFDNNNWRWAEF